MELDLTQEISPQQTVKVSARLVAANYILALSSQELQEVIASELSENPALEMMDAPTCPVCGTELQGSICPACIRQQKTADSPVEDQGTTYDEPYTRNQESARDEDFDPLIHTAAEETVAERLLSELGAAIDERDRPIAEFLVGSLDERGYLSTTIEEVADHFNLDPARVRRVLEHLQSLEPVGVGARNLRECLLIQTDFLERLGVEQPYAREIISDYLPELGSHKFSRIAQQLRISPDQVAEVWEFVKAKLNPHPLYGFAATNTRDRDTRAMYMLPDVIVRRGESGGFEVEVVESRRFLLRISPIYSHLNTASVPRLEQELSTDEKKHVQHYVNRAKLFIANINQRRQTLHNITRCLVELQREYLEQGVRHLKPLSRAAVANKLTIHESTVSRATASKHVMLPSGEIIPFSHFFTPSLSVKDVIKEIIEHEGAPLTDAEIAERLRQRGIHIARRTVAKYRIQLDILPSSLR